MSIKIGKRGVVPNWIEDNNWSDFKRLILANEIMAFSPRDWSINFNRGDVPESPDPELWALWCLITQDTKDKALECWYKFCDQYNWSPSHACYAYLDYLLKESITQKSR